MNIIIGILIIGIVFWSVLGAFIFVIDSERFASDIDNNFKLILFGCLHGLIVPVVLIGHILFIKFWNSNFRQSIKNWFIK
jgi:hypothetical protein